MGLDPCLSGSRLVDPLCHVPMNPKLQTDQDVDDLMVLFFEDENMPSKMVQHLVSEIAGGGQHLNVDAMMEHEEAVTREQREQSAGTFSDVPLHSMCASGMSRRSGTGVSSRAFSPSPTSAAPCPVLSFLSSLQEVHPKVSLSSLCPSPSPIPLLKLSFDLPAAVPVLPSTPHGYLLTGER
ncbi:uncharacterized protein [Paramormyrops kingsleyae]|uniref:uncharacterized protein isoform X2 n=1 Tax=Paramormyrops kingsleyae TaxID=1676925 RepID=UPI003B972595